MKGRSDMIDAVNIFAMKGGKVNSVVRTDRQKTQIKEVNYLFNHNRSTAQLNMFEMARVIEDVNKLKYANISEKEFFTFYDYVKRLLTRKPSTEKVA